MKSRSAACQSLSDNIKTGGPENAGVGVEGNERSQGWLATGNPSGYLSLRSGIARLSGGDGFIGAFTPAVTSCNCRGCFSL